jgi:hypothetical protein
MIAVSWMPLLAVSPSGPAAQGEYVLGFLFGIVAVAIVFMFAVLAIVMAVTRRTTGWIIASSISGLLMVAIVFCVITAISLGIAKSFSKNRAPARPHGGPPEIIVGKVIPFLIRKPPDWTAKRDQGAFDTVIGDGRGYVGVIARKADLSSNEELVRFARHKLETTATEVRFSANDIVTIDGRQWIRFTANAKVGDMPCAYRYYTYVGQEGAVQVLCWSFQKDWDREVAALELVVQTVRIPKPTLLIPHR